METQIEHQLKELQLLQERIISLIEQLRNNAADKDEWLDSNDLSRMLKVTEKTLYRWRKLKLLIPYQIGRKCYYSRNAIANLMDNKPFLF